MSDYADLELSLHRREVGYAVEMRYSQPNSDAEIRLGQGQPIPATLDVAALQMLAADPAAYGKALAQALFADANLLAAFAQARASAQSLKAPLRIRLIIGSSAPELNALYWETLRDPQDNTPLFTGEQVCFSRYLSSMDWRPVYLRSKSDLDALAAVVNPSNLGDYSLEAVDVAAELERAKQGLDNIPVTSLPSEAKKRCTLNAVIEGLRNGAEILYLVAHGALIKGEPWILLEDDEGKVARVSGLDLVTRIKELDELPRLIVLASCQSAGKGTGDALQALGPKLAEAGVPAVVAMQGSVSMDTVAKFMPVFFTELQKDGLIDRALAVARGTVRERSDYWMPLLFMRLKSGRIWYVPGFGEEGGGFEKWPSLMRSIQNGQCTPILGPGVLEPLLGPWRDVSQKWADEYHFPLSPFQRDVLPQVAQYLSVNQDRNFPRDALNDHIRQTIQSRYASALTEDLKQPRAPVDKLINAAGAVLCAQDACEQHKVMAGLPLPIYVTTNFDSLLSNALSAAGKKPEMIICPWNEYITADSVFDREPDYRPTPERPLVYHLFGHLSQPDSLVLTEDDHFDFLIGVTGNKDLIPGMVRRVLADTALLFLGFQLADWAFRVLFRTIMGQQGGGRRSRYAHIGVQLALDENRIISPERARKYLETYFDEAAISIYWGDSDDFIKELNQQWKKQAGS
ncbi:MAG: SIR2 family protein [Anaerolineales bacterium]|nr:SIR2 family protein [Anaerolineales bacterium]